MSTDSRVTAYCYADGVIYTTEGSIPDGALPITKAPDRETMKNALEGTARRSYKDENGNYDWLVPGIPEAKNQSKAYEAFEKYRSFLKRAIEREIEDPMPGPGVG